MFSKIMICFCFLQPFVCLFFVFGDDGQCWQREWLPTLAAFQLPFVCSSLDQTLQPPNHLFIFIYTYVWLFAFIIVFVLSIVCLFVFYLGFSPPQNTCLFVSIQPCLLFFSLLDQSRHLGPSSPKIIWLSLFVFLDPSLFVCLCVCCQTSQDSKQCALHSLKPSFCTDLIFGCRLFWGNYLLYFPRIKNNQIRGDNQSSGVSFHTR